MHTHGHPGYHPPNQVSWPGNERAYFSHPDTRFANMFLNSEPLYLLNHLGEFMRLDPPARVGASGTANPMEGTALLLRTIPLQDLRKLHECAQAGIRRDSSLRSQIRPW
jgi:hypothetical protein